MTQREKRIDWGDRDDADFVDVPYWRVAGSWATGGFVLGFIMCTLLLTTCEARAGGPVEEELPNCDVFTDPDEYEACVVYVAEQLQQQMAFEPEQYALPNQPTTVVVDGGTSVGEWAALLTGIAALLGALEAFRRRKHRAPD